MSFTSTRKVSTGALLVWAAMAFGTAQADTLTFNVNNVPSYSPDGPQNIKETFMLSPLATITSIDWNVSLTAYQGSALDQMFLSITGYFGGGVAIEPGYGDSFAGTKSYSGSADLITQGITFAANTDGTVNLEFWDYSNDLPGADGVWNSGTVTIEYSPTAAVPEPATASLMGVGLMAALAWGRRRRSGGSEGRLAG